MSKAKGALAAVEAVEYTPTTSLDLDSKMVKELKGLEPGEKVQVMITGRVESLELRAPSEYDKERGEKGNRGYLRVKQDKIEICPCSSKASAQMMSLMDEED